MAKSVKTVAPAASGVVSFIKASGTSQVIIDSSEDDLSDNAIPYAGTGGYLLRYTLRTQHHESTCTADVGARPQGAPLYQLLVRVALTGSVPRYLVLFLADIHNKYHPLVYRHLVSTQQRVCKR